MLSFHRLLSTSARCQWLGAVEMYDDKRLPKTKHALRRWAKEQGAKRYVLVDRAGDEPVNELPYPEPSWFLVRKLAGRHARKLPSNSSAKLKHALGRKSHMRQVEGFFEWEEVNGQPFVAKEERLLVIPIDFEQGDGGGEENGFKVPRIDDAAVDETLDKFVSLGDDDLCEYLDALDEREELLPFLRLLLLDGHPKIMFAGAVVSRRVLHCLLRKSAWSLHEYDCVEVLIAFECLCHRERNAETLVVAWLKRGFGRMNSRKQLIALAGIVRQHNNRADASIERYIAQNGVLTPLLCVAACCHYNRISAPFRAQHIVLHSAATAAVPRDYELVLSMLVRSRLRHGVSANLLELYSSIKAMVGGGRQLNAIALEYAYAYAKTKHPHFACQMMHDFDKSQRYREADRLRALGAIAYSFCSVGDNAEARALIEQCGLADDSQISFAEILGTNACILYRVKQLARRERGADDGEALAANDGEPRAALVVAARSTGLRARRYFAKHKLTHRLRFCSTLCNQQLAVWSALGELDRVAAMYAEMRAHGVAASATTINTVTFAYCRAAKTWVDVERIEATMLQDMDELDAKPDVTFGSTLLSAHVGDLEDKIACFERYYGAGAGKFPPTNVAYAHLIRAYVAAGDIEGAEQRLADMLRDRLPIDTSCIRPLLAHYCAANAVDNAERLVKLLRAHDVFINGGLANLLADAYARLGDERSADRTRTYTCATDSLAQHEIVELRTRRKSEGAVRRRIQA
jgi:pentatricopeptide repeat protein